MRLSIIALAGLLVVPAFAGAEGTTRPAAETSRQKKDKQQKDKDKSDPQAKVYTNDDLKDAGKGEGAVTFLAEPQGSAGHSSEGVPASAEGGSSSEAGRPAGSEEGRPASSEEGRNASSEEGAVGEAGWRSRAQQYRTAVRHAEGEVALLEKKLDALHKPQSQPQPIEALQPDPQHQLTKDSTREELEAQLQTARQELADAQRALEDFMEDARKHSVPPGWVEDR